VVGWRGDGTGRFPEAEPPVQWGGSEKKNILWEAPVGKSQSSPVVVGDRIFVTAEQDLLLCVDRKSGRVLWRQDNGFRALPPGLAAAPKRWPAGPGGGYSIPTPVADGTSVYVVHATGIVVCHGFDGSRRWIRYFNAPQVTEFGRSASPLLVDGKLLVSISSLLALDPRTGETLWEAPEAKPSYGTPSATRIGDVAVVLTPNGDCVRVSDGKLLATKLGSTTFSSPLVHDGVVYFADSPTVAVQIPIQSAEPIQFRKLWENEDPEGDFYASPICHDGVLCCVSNEGVLYALDAKTGGTVYRRELDIRSMSGKPGVEPANLYASVTLVGKHLLVVNDAGQALVLAPGREYKEVARSWLGDGSGASPVAEGKHLFLRGRSKLYCISPP
jgi:outer membrane protein assembly factor BamB